MSKVYLYSRVSTDQQSTQQQERTAYEWLKCHDMKVDEVVSDEGISGGVSFADRNLGRILLPKMEAGDVLIVSEVSRLGRSMFDLSKLIHTELKPRKIRLVCVSMGIDLRCDKMTAIDELILNNFSFAAQLEKQLISERTFSALQVKKKQGVKLGGAAEAWLQSYKNKTKEQKEKEQMERGETKRQRYLESRDVQVFLRIIKNVFSDACFAEDPKMWDWSQVTTRGDYKARILSLMRDYKELDANGLFAKWDLSNIEEKEQELQLKLCANIQNIRKSLKIKK